MSYFIFMLLLISLNTTKTFSRVRKLDCNDAELTKLCECVMDVQNNYMVQIECSSYLSNESNKLPDLQAQTVSAKKAYTKWPAVPKSYLKVVTLDLSINKITKIGDLTNLKNLQFLNISFNLLDEINPAICTLRDLYALDLSFNLLQVLKMENFVCETDSSVLSTKTNYIFSNLEYLFLLGNKIKQINNLDLLIVGMPILSSFDISFNQIKEINVSKLSVNSINVMKKLNQVIKAYNNREFFVNTISQRTEFVYCFSNNVIESLFFNFGEIYNFIADVIPITDNLLLRFSSILLENNRINCDCGLYKDFNFLVNGPFSESIYYSNLSEASIAATKCATISKNEISVLSTLLKNRSSMISSNCKSVASSIFIYSNYALFLMNKLILFFALKACLYIFF